MIKLKLKIEVNGREVDTTPHEDAVQKAIFDIGVAMAKKSLGNLTDPQTGKTAEVAFTSLPEGINVRITGSDWIRAEAQRRLAHLSD